MSVVFRVFDPAMCCSTGVCGPSVDPELARFAADLDWLQKRGVTVERYNLSSQPGAFADTPIVKAALEARGVEALPLLVVGDRIVAEGTYPSRQTLAALAGIVVRAPELVIAQSACCGPSAGEKKSGCC